MAGFTIFSAAVFRMQNSLNREDFRKDRLPFGINID